MNKIKENKKLLLIIGIVLVLVIGVVAIITISGSSKNETSISKYQGNNIFEKVENMLKEKKFTYDTLVKVGMNYGASNLVEYALSDGTVFEIYTFVDNSVVYADILKTNKLYVLGTEKYYEVDTIKSLNVAIRYLAEGDKINEIKDIL